MKANRWFVFIGIILTGACIGANGQLGQKGEKSVNAAKEKRPAPAVTNVAVVLQLPVIMYIERRGQTITVKAGPKGPVYSVKTAEGKTVFEDLSAEQLRAQAPEIHQFIKTAVANGSGKSGVVIDARLSATR